MNQKNKRITQMLHNVKLLKGYKLNSLEGEFGKLKEFYFDDKHWVIRYLVADTGNWLTGRQVLLSPYALGRVSNDEQHIFVELTKKQIKDSPSLSTDIPVSRQFEKAYFEYYSWPLYWVGPYMWGPYPYIERDPEKNLKACTPGVKSWDHHLRSTHDVSGHHIQASDGIMGHVEDFIIDDETWAIRYLIVNTQNWWPGKKILISPQWVKRVSWLDSTVYVNCSRESILHSPEYTDESLLTRDYETALQQYYDRLGYWDEEAATQ